MASRYSKTAQPKREFGSADRPQTGGAYEMRTRANSVEQGGHWDDGGRKKCFVSESVGDQRSAPAPDGVPSPSAVPLRLLETPHLLKPGF